jgi:hypothetical protein
MAYKMVVTMISKTKFALVPTVLAPTVLAVALLIPGMASACSSCGCTLTSDWESQGLTATPGLRFDLRYDYLNQNQLRASGHAVDRSTLSYPADREIEEKTRNHYVTLGVDYSPNADWGLSLSLPYIDRYHETIAPGDTRISASQSKAVGDIRDSPPATLLAYNLALNCRPDAFTIISTAAPKATYPKCRAIPLTAAFNPAPAPPTRWSDFIILAASARIGIILFREWRKSRCIPARITSQGFPST